jgi:hypothetical protein
MATSIALTNTAMPSIRLFELGDTATSPAYLVMTIGTLPRESGFLNQLRSPGATAGPPVLAEVLSRPPH